MGRLKEQRDGCSWERWEKILGGRGGARACRLIEMGGRHRPSAYPCLLA